jgi:hypothetical protein
MNRGWMSAIIDVEEAFLKGRFANGEELYIEVPDGFRSTYECTLVWYKASNVLFLQDLRGARKEPGLQAIKG